MHSPEDSTRNQKHCTGIFLMRRHSLVIVPLVKAHCIVTCSNWRILLSTLIDMSLIFLLTLISPISAVWVCNLQRTKRGFEQWFCNSRMAPLPSAAVFLLLMGKGFILRWRGVEVGSAAVCTWEGGLERKVDTWPFFISKCSGVFTAVLVLLTAPPLQMLCLLTLA